MNAVGDLGGDTARVRDVLQDRPNRVFFGVDRTISYAVAQSVAWKHGIFPLSDLLGAIVRYAIQIGVLQGFQLRSDQHPKTPAGPRMTNDTIFAQRDDRCGEVPVSLTRQGLRNMRINKHRKFAWVIYPVISSKRRLSQLISEISRLTCYSQKPVCAQWFFKPDTIAGKHHVCLGEKKPHSALIKQIDWIMSIIAFSDLDNMHGPKISGMPIGYPVGELGEREWHSHRNGFWMHPLLSLQNAI